MARPLFEQYKDALRRGHVALLGDELEAALAAYREAASLVPDRPLPYSSIGSVLQRLGRSDEALAEYDRAIALAPSDGSVIAARDAILAALAMAARSAALENAPEAPAQPEPSAGEPEPEPELGLVSEPEALTVPAPEPMPEPEAPAASLEPQPGPAVAPEPEPTPQPEWEGTPESQPEPQPESQPEPPAAVAREPHLEASIEADAAALDAVRAALQPESEATTRAPSTGGTPTELPVEPTAEPDGSWPAIDLPSPPPPPLVGPPPDPTVLQAEAEALLDAGDERGARDLLLISVVAHREAGRLDAAIDACLQLLAIAPGDPRVHLAIANLQLDRGWRQVATEKIELLLRLTSLSGDVQAEADVHLLAADRLREESPARLDARRRGLPPP